MKKIYVLAIGLLTATLALSGCRGRGRGRGGDSGDNSDVTSGNSNNSGNSGNNSNSGSSGTSEEPPLPGFDGATWITGQGYTYSDTFPTSLIKTFLGAQSADIKEPASLVGGCYYKQNAATESAAANFDVVADGTQLNSYGQARITDGWTKIFQTEYGYGFVDPSATYEVDVMESEDDNYNACAPTHFTFYKVSDLWDTSNTKTEDDEWSEEALAEVGDKFWETFASTIPFTQLGQKYTMYFNDNYWTRAMIQLFDPTADVSEYPDYISVYDGSLNDTYLDDYDTVLTDAGFEYDTQNSYYHGEVLSFWAMNIKFYWGEYGNEIDAYKELVEMDEWPTDLLGQFTETMFESTVAVPQYGLTTTEGAKFTLDFFTSYLEDETGSDDDDELMVYDYADDEEGEGEEETISTIDVMEIGVTKSKYTEFQAYATAFENMGANVDFVDSDDDYPYFDASYGKLNFKATFIQDYDETNGYSTTDGSVTIDVYSNPDGVETKGIYLDSDTYNVGIGKDLTLGFSTFDIDRSKLVWTSDATGTATVSNGVVHGVAEGQATITVFEDANENGKWDEGEALADASVTVREAIVGDATMACGENATEVTVNGKAAIKVGTGKAGGTMTITVPAGTTQVDFYAAGWKGSSTIVAISGATVSPASVSLTADTGISNNTPFTLAGSEATYAVSIALTGVTAEATLTLEASSRFVVWGATYTA